MNTRMILCVGLLLAATSSLVHADPVARADSHAPIGVMGDHMHARGEWMFSYRYMQMSMAGNLKGSSSIDADTIATTESNPFAATPGMPPTLRIVPLEMDMDMHMPGLMYAPSDRITLMLMTMYWQKSMSLRTYMGGMGSSVLGDFQTGTSGWGDTKVSAMIRLLDTNRLNAHATIGVSLPTGSTGETTEVLTPMGMVTELRAPYPMQLGSGSYDPLVGATISSTGNGALGWGAQWSSVFRVSKNDDQYQLGDEHRLTGWLSYRFIDSVSASLRIEYNKRGNVSGLDPLIMGPVQTADPQRLAYQRTDLSAGMNLAGAGAFHGWRLGLEFSVPVQQRVDGPQLETDRQVTLGLQKTID